MAVRFVYPALSVSCSRNAWKIPVKNCFRYLHKSYFPTTFNFKFMFLNRLPRYNSKWKRSSFIEITYNFLSEIAGWTCWNCKYKCVEIKLSCEKCGSIADPQYLCMLNYFELLKQKRTYDIKPGDLTKEFRNLQRNFHPDKFAGKAQTEKDFSEQVSSLVNKAYQTLLKPMDRAEYLLQLSGKPFDEKAVEMDPPFLMGMMETNEAISECKSLEEVKKLKASNDAYVKLWAEKMSTCFKNNDFDGALLCLARLKYYTNLDERCKELIATFT